MLPIVTSWALAAHAQVKPERIVSSGITDAPQSGVIIPWASWPGKNRITESTPRHPTLNAIPAVVESRVYRIWTPKPKGSNYLLEKWTVTAFWLCTTELNCEDPVVMWGSQAIVLVVMALVPSFVCSSWLCQKTNQTLIDGECPRQTVEKLH